MVAKLDEIADKITFVTFKHPRATTAENLYQLSISKNKQKQDDWQKAIAVEYSLQEEGDILVVTGSLYFIKQVKAFLKTILVRV